MLPSSSPQPDVRNRSQFRPARGGAVRAVCVRLKSGPPRTPLVACNVARRAVSTISDSTMCGFDWPYWPIVFSSVGVADVVDAV